MVVINKSTIKSCLILLIFTGILFTSCTSDVPVSEPEVIPSIQLTLTPTATATNEPSLTPTQIPSATITPMATQTPYIFGPGGFPPDINPLTGLKVDDPQIFQRRPVTIKVSNFPREGRPHAGLSAADIVFDYSIGEGTNRFLAIYYSQDAPLVGPIRSGRLVDAQLVRLYAGILGYAGADPTLVDPTLQDSLGIRAIPKSDATCPGLCDHGFPSVFSVFADTKQFSDYAINVVGTGNNQYNLDGMVFNPQLPDGGNPGDQISVLFNYYNRAGWQYDQNTGTYLRWIEIVDADNNIKMIPLVDRNNNQQLGVNNLVILFANYNEYAPTLHSIDIWNNPDGKPAILFRDGKKFDIFWKTLDTDLPIHFFQPDGSPIPFKPGNSWIVIVGDSSSVIEGDTGQWNVTFSIP